MKHKRNTHELKEYKATLSLTDIQREVLVGTLLGDATIPAQKGAQSHNVEWEQKIAKKEYVEHIYNVFEDWVGTPPAIRNIKGGGAADRQSSWFRTYKHPAFSFYRHLFYFLEQGQETARKRVPVKIGNLLTPRVLAYWFMDDGNLHRTNKTYSISTHSFTHDEHQLLKIALKNNFELEVSVVKDKDKYRLNIKREHNSCEKFKDLVSPYMVECMKYKLLD